ncbi:hypothetical protein KQX54_021553 [Cotesia glomerata]|uniref:Uncharacterized protein n=1 Tax=Cotesia glomerata TaxID=32391 RepID=A0AAV7JA96_COTGL|nr:hypothetical protein KQX54_021553 [Cotesia glomerata]
MWEVRRGHKERRTIQFINGGITGETPGGRDTNNPMANDRHHGGVVACTELEEKGKDNAMLFARRKVYGGKPTGRARGESMLY